MIGLLLQAAGLVSLLAAASLAGYVLGLRRAAGAFSERHMALEEERVSYRETAKLRRGMTLSSIRITRGS